MTELQLLMKGARLAGRPGLVDIAIADGRITAIGPRLDGSGDTVDACGALVLPGLVDAHLGT